MSKDSDNKNGNNKKLAPGQNASTTQSAATGGQDSHEQRKVGDSKGRSQKSGGEKSSGGEEE